MLPLNQEPAANSQGPAASAKSGDENSLYSDGYSAWSQDFGRTEFHPDIYIRTNDEHWTVTPATNKYAAAAASFSSVTTEDREKKEVCQLVTMTCVKRSLSMDELINDHNNILVSVPIEVNSQTRNMLECLSLVGKPREQEPKCGFRAQKRSVGPGTWILQRIC